MTVDKNGVELKVGDTVRYQGTVAEIGPSGIYTDNGVWEMYFSPSFVEFVSRPEPTVSVELTRDELNEIRDYFCTGTVWHKMKLGLLELLNEA